MPHHRRQTAQHRVRRRIPSGNCRSAPSDCRSGNSDTQNELLEKLADRSQALGTAQAVALREVLAFQSEEFEKQLESELVAVAEQYEDQIQQLHAEYERNINQLVASRLEQERYQIREEFIDMYGRRCL